MRVLATGLVIGVMLSLVTMLTPAPSSATYTMICSGFADCKAKGYKTYDYQNQMSTMWWRMYAGRNCVNYAAWRMVRAGLPNVRPWTGSGNGENWGNANSAITDNDPMVGSVAWWDSNQGGASSYGHVGVVERVVSASEIWVSESNWGSDFSWRVIYKGDNRWPTGFIHFKDQAVEVTRAPVITASPKVGERVRLDKGRYTRKATTNVSWYVNGRQVSGATGTSFTPGPKKLGKTITAKVGAKAAGFASVTAEAPGAAVAKGDLSVASVPAITGNPQVEEKLTVAGAEFSPPATGQRVQWFADGEPITGATEATLTLARAQADAMITVAVTGRRGKAYRPQTTSSAVVGPVLAPQIQVTQPATVAGTPHLGVPLTVEPGAFEPSSAVPRYRWLRDGEKITGAVTDRYTPTAADVGHTLAVRVILERSKYLPISTIYDLPGQVTTDARLTLRPRGRKDAVLVRASVEAPGVPSVSGKAIVRVGSQSETVDIVDGQIRVRIPVVTGQRKVTVTYAGTSLILGAKLSTTVTVS